MGWGKDDFLYMRLFDKVVFDILWFIENIYRCLVIVFNIEVLDFLKSGWVNFGVLKEFFGYLKFGVGDDNRFSVNFFLCL